MLENDLHQVNQGDSDVSLLNIKALNMISKIIHFMKYGMIGGLLGGMLEVFVNLDEPSFLGMALAIWAGVGAVIGMLYSIVIEKWFNETYHD